MWEQLHILRQLHLIATQLAAALLPVMQHGRCTNPTCLSKQQSAVSSYVRPKSAGHTCAGALPRETGCTWQL